MVEVNGAYKYSRYENIWLKSLCVTSNIHFFAKQDGQPAKQLIT